MVPPCSDRISRVPPYSSPQSHNTRTGLSPTKARLSRRFRLIQLRHWPGPRSLATTSGVSVDVLSSGYLDVSVPRVCSLAGTPYGVGCPIQKSTDQSLFAAPHGLSQRITSFIASCRQGIHRMPLRHLITLIINVHLFQEIIPCSHASWLAPTAANHAPNDWRPTCGLGKQACLTCDPDNPSMCLLQTRSSMGPFVKTQAFKGLNTNRS